MPDLPTTLALTSIPDGSARTAAPVRNNFSALQTAVNALIAAFSGGSSGQVLRATDTDTIAWSSLNTSYRKTTSKQVVSTVAETDLLNAEITVGAGVLGANGVLRLSAWGDWINNTGAPAAPPRMKLKLGATTLLDTAALAANMSTSATREAWRVTVTIQNLGATNAQWSALDLKGGLINGVGNAVANFATGEGLTFATALSGGGGFLEAVGGGSSAIDTTASQALVLSVINGVASASYDTTLKGALVEVV